PTAPPGPGGLPPSSGGGGNITVRVGAVLGLAPLAPSGQRGSMGAEVGVGYRLGSAMEADLLGIVGPSPGARVSVSRAVVFSPVRLSGIFRASIWPGVAAYGAGLGLGLELPLSRSFSLAGTLAGEAYLS